MTKCKQLLVTLHEKKGGGGEKQAESHNMQFCYNDCMKVKALSCFL